MNTQSETTQTFSIGSFLRSRTGLVLLAFLAIAVFFLITEHTVHVFGLLPYALLILCPILHLFMHGRHGGHGNHAGGQNHQHSGHQHGGGEKE